LNALLASAPTPFRTRAISLRRTVQAVRSGRSVEDVMHDKAFEAIKAKATR
jgi:hypothetical protein